MANFGFSLFGLSIGVGLFFDAKGISGINFGVGISAFKYGGYSGVCVTKAIQIKGNYIGYNTFQEIVNQLRFTFSGYRNGRFGYGYQNHTYRRW